MNLYKHGKTYHYRFMWTVKSEDGAKSYVIRRSAHTGSKRQAEGVGEEHRRALRLGLIHPLDGWPKLLAAEVPRVREFAKRFLDHAGLHTKPGTARFYGGCLKRVLSFIPLADAVLTDVTGEMIGKYTSWRRSQAAGNSLAAVNAELRTLRRLFNLAEEWAVIPKSPAIHELPGQKGRERVVGFREEAAYLAAASETVRDVSILAVDTGVRPDSELFPLEWRNVHLDRTPDAPDGLIHIDQGKTDYAVRNKPLTPRARSVLEMRRVICGECRYVFPGKGRSGHLRSVQHPHVAAIRKAGLEPFELYCWRHTFGTRCAESGMDKFTLARLMGHSSPRVAERYYVHVTEPHVTAGFGRFVEYISSKQIDSFPAGSDKLQ